IMIIHKGKLVVIGEPKKLVENLRKKYPNASLETVFFEYTGENFEQIDLEVV
ncbi:MAG TPA: ABC transporter ATP-binding protein, partial [Pseudothermotoga sp.]|nr:ABC transporter ATP-binding protein [Pseudothermotoga sp.]